MFPICKTGFYRRLAGSNTVNIDSQRKIWQQILDDTVGTMFVLYRHFGTQFLSSTRQFSNVLFQLIILQLQGMASQSCDVTPLVSKFIARYGGCTVRTVALLDSQPNERVYTTLSFVDLQSSHLHFYVSWSACEAHCLLDFVTQKPIWTQRFNSIGLATFYDRFWQSKSIHRFQSVDANHFSEEFYFWLDWVECRASFAGNSARGWQIKVVAKFCLTIHLNCLKLHWILFCFAQRGHGLGNLLVGYHHG